MAVELVLSILNEFYYLVCISTKKKLYLNFTVNPILSDGGTDPYITQTVYGFLDFTTTIGNTVMVFSPQSAPPIGMYGINNIK